MALLAANESAKDKTGRMSFARMMVQEEARQRLAVYFGLFTDLVGFGRLLPMRQWTERHNLYFDRLPTLRD